jgi:RNA polymerase sigma factor (sigma-70 family)
MDKDRAAGLARYTSIKAMKFGNKPSSWRVSSYATMTALAPIAVPRIEKSIITMDPARKLALFEQTIIPHLNAAYNLARWLTRNSHDADDLVQEAYLKAFRAFETFQGKDSESGRAWLLTVVRNTCFTWARKKGDQPTAEFDEQLHSSAETPDAESILLNQAALSSLKNCVEALPLEFREAIVLRELEELSYKDIAEIARVPVGTVMSRLARARKRLQECLTGVSR